MKDLLAKCAIVAVLASGPLAIWGKAHELRQWEERTRGAVAVWRERTSPVANIQYVLFDSDGDKSIDVVVEYRGSMCSPRGCIPSSTHEYARGSLSFDYVMTGIAGGRMYRLQ